MKPCWMNEWMRLIKYDYLSLHLNHYWDKQSIFYKGSEGKFHVRRKAYTVVKRNSQRDTIWKFSRRVAARVYISSTAFLCWVKFYMVLKTLCLVKITLSSGDNVRIFFRCKYSHGEDLLDSFHIPRGWKLLLQLRQLMDYICWRNDCVMSTIGHLGVQTWGEHWVGFCSSCRMAWKQGDPQDGKRRKDSKKSATFSYTRHVGGGSWLLN